tara:strand:- start:632 stop:1168 length:537 start_codon:yes stop_codon:yes gene_type:complete
MEKKLTSYELLDNYFDVHLDMQMEDDETKKEELEQQLVTIEQAISQKIDNIEHVMVEKKLGIEQIKSQIKAYQYFVTLLKNRLKSFEKGSERLDQLVMMLIENIGELKDGKITIEHNGFKYTVYESPGSLTVTNQDAIPPEYTRINVELDKAKLRKYIIQHGDTEYAIVPKMKRLKIT